jgi:hypothetical protein
VIVAPQKAAGAILNRSLDRVPNQERHPYEYLYNSLVGGLEGASRRADYWVKIMLGRGSQPRGLSGSDGHIHQFRSGNTVAVCGERVSFENQADGRLQFTRDWSHADFFIAPTHMNCDRVLQGKIVNVIERVGVPIGVGKGFAGNRRTRPMGIE